MLRYPGFCLYYTSLESLTFVRIDWGTVSSASVFSNRASNGLFKRGRNTWSAFPWLKNYWNLIAMRRFRRGFLVRTLLTITSLSLVCCLVAIFETVHEISSDHLLRSQGVNNHFSGFPSALASYNVENTGDEILPNLLSESLYREQGRGLKSFPKLKQWEEYQNSPLYNTTFGKLPSLSTGFLGCSEIKAIKVVGNIGRGYTKTVQKGLHRDVEVAIKSVRLDNEDIKRCVLHSTGNRTVDECFIFAKYKLAKEIIMLQQLRHANIVKVS